MVKFLTLNTHSWMETEAEEKLKMLGQAILDDDYDIICLQEINQEIHSDKAQKTPYYTALPDTPTIHLDHYALQLVDFLEQHGHTYYWSWAYNHIGYDKYNEGVAVLSKTPITPIGILVSDVDDERDYHTRRVLAVKTQIEGRELLAVSVHLSWWNKGFQGEWHKLEQALKAYDMPLVIMGDFNNPVGNEGYQTVLDSSLKLQDSHLVAAEHSGDYTIKADIDGWEGNNHCLKVDHIFTSPAIKPLNSTVIFDGRHYPVISDHFGLSLLADWEENHD